MADKIVEQGCRGCNQLKVAPFLRRIASLLGDNPFVQKSIEKKVCMIAYTNYLTDARVRREAETLASQPGYYVSFISLKEGNLPESYTVDRVKVKELNVRKYRGKSNLIYLFSYLQFLIKSFCYCTSYFFQGKIDVIHVHNMPNFLVFAAIFPRFFGKKVILDLHDSMPETYSAKFEGGSNRLLFKLLCLEEAICCGFVNKIICVNQVQYNVLINRGIPSSKLHISLNVPDHKKFYLKKRNEFLKKTSNPFRLVYHGTITKRLGVDLAIQAVAKLIGKIPNLEFFILGSGDDREEFIELSRQLGVEKKIHFNKGMISVDELNDALSGMDLGIISNRKNIATELMLPVKMLEYVALDIPVVASRLKTIAYYFTDEMVTFFEPENVDSLASAIWNLYRDNSKRRNQGQMAKNFLKQYGWEKHQIELINLYEEL